MYSNYKQNINLTKNVTKVSPKAKSQTNKTAMSSTLLQPAVKRKTSAILFHELQKELLATPIHLPQDTLLNGILMVQIMHNKKKDQMWYIHLTSTHDVRITKTEPVLTPKELKDVRVGAVEMEDSDMFKYISGEITGIKMISEGMFFINLHPMAIADI